MGVPGTVAGLVHVLDRYGTLPLVEVLAPAIELAEQGILVSRDLSESLESRRERLQRWPATAAIFYHEDGRPYQRGERLVQSDLAWSLRQIAAHGAEAFYKGAIAERIAADMAAHGGSITLQDLAAYRVAVRTPVRGTYRGYEVASMPPPSSGGVHLVQILNLLEDYPLASLGHNGA